MLTLDSVWKARPGQANSYILQDCSYAFKSDRIYAILGQSGAGKTTLLRLMNSLTTPDRGRILLEGQDIDTIHPAQLRSRISLLFQTPAFVGQTVEEDLAFARQFSHREGVNFASLLGRVHLDTAFLSRRVGTLSVGEQQRVCLARTLVAKPEVLLLDEPTAALDDATANQILELIREISSTERLLTIFVTHRKSHARKVGQDLLQLATGKLLDWRPENKEHGS